MCETVIIRRHGRTIECETLGQLRSALRHRVVIYPGYDMPLPGRMCLCPVDMDATAQRAGMRATQDGDVWVFTDA